MSALIDQKAERRFWEKVEKTDACWLWTAARQNRGYGVFSFGPRATVKRLLAHRVSYTLANGPIPDDLTIDHLCRVKHCVNPQHLEVVSRSENTTRAHLKTECIRGHDMSRTRRTTVSGTPYCGECQQVRNAARRIHVA